MNRDGEGHDSTIGHAAPSRGGAAVGHEGGHLSTGFYWMIGLILAVVTAMEVAVYYIDALAVVETPVILVLTAAKFALVVMFFMHLRTDSKIFTGLFMAGFALATFMILALIVLYHYLPMLEAGMGI